MEKDFSSNASITAKNENAIFQVTQAIHNVGAGSIDMIKYSTDPGIIFN